MNFVTWRLKNYRLTITSQLPFNHYCFFLLFNHFYRCCYFIIMKVITSLWWYHFIITRFSRSPRAECVYLAGTMTGWRCLLFVTILSLFLSTSYIFEMFNIIEYQYWVEVSSLLLSFLSPYYLHSSHCQHHNSLKCLISRITTVIIVTLSALFFSSSA